MSDGANEKQGTQEMETPPVAETGGASKSRAQRASDQHYRVSARSAQVFRDEKLKSHAKMTALAMAFLMGEADEVAVTLEALAEMVGAAARTVARQIDILESEKYIEKISRGDIRAGTTGNIYRASARWIDLD